MDLVAIHWRLVESWNVESEGPVWVAVAVWDIHRCCVETEAVILAWLETPGLSMERHSELEIAQRLVCKIPEAVVRPESGLARAVRKDCWCSQQQDSGLGC